MLMDRVTPPDAFAKIFQLRLTDPLQFLNTSNCQKKCAGATTDSTSSSPAVWPGPQCSIWNSLLLEYLTPAEIAEYDVPINWKLVDSKQGDPKFGAPQRIAYRRFAESKGIDSDNEDAVRDALRNEARRRFEEKEEKWRRGED
jgi:hypothetical protein